jgi:GntR family carbon starvation induced transcriptional regulator
MSPSSSLLAVDAAPSLTPGGGKTLADNVYRQMAADIVSGRLAPGTKLAFHLLRDRYAVSVSTAREALQRLAGEHLVESIGQRGFRVAPLSLTELDDLNSLRMVLEPRALRESIAAGGGEWEERLMLASHRLGRLQRPDDLDEKATDLWEAGHKELHAALISACPSRWLLQFCSVLYDQSSRYRRFIFTRYSHEKRHRDDVDAEHKAIVAAALARDADKAVTLLTDHYENTARRVRAKYSAEPNAV